MRNPRTVINNCNSNVVTVQRFGFDTEVAPVIHRLQGIRDNISPNLIQFSDKALYKRQLSVVSFDPNILKGMVEHKQGILYASMHINSARHFSTRARVRSKTVDKLCNAFRTAPNIAKRLSKMRVTLDLPKFILSIHLREVAENLLILLMIMYSNSN